MLLYDKSNVVYTVFFPQFLIFQNNIVLWRYENEHGRLDTVIFLKN